LYRALLQETKKRSLESTFEVTLEATHHGPHSSLPACFCEIGSTEEQWGNEDAGLAWADILEAHLGLSVAPAASALAEQAQVDDNAVPTMPDHKDGKGAVVMVVIGGGHYTPKMNDAARVGPPLYCGHALATYTLSGYFDGSAESPIDGGWKAVVDEIVLSTRVSFPEASLVVFVDKKAFGSSGRRLIMSHLEEQGIKTTNSFSDVKGLLK